MEEIDEEYILYCLRQLCCRLKVSASGVGVFSIAPILKGTDPFRLNRSTEFYHSVHKDDIKNLPEYARQYVQDFFPMDSKDYYQFPDYPPQQIDMSYFVNHSKQPNLITEDDGDTFQACRDIAIGEELTADYSTYSKEPK